MNANDPTNLVECILDQQDKFCWVCDKKCKIPKRECIKCFRSFHESCLQFMDKYDSPDTNNSFSVCAVCASLEISKKDFEGKESVLRLLKYTKTAILHHDKGKFKMLEKFNRLKDAEAADIIVRPMDLNDVFFNIDINLYESTDEFLTHIECIYHNCIIFYGVRHEITLTCLDLLRFSQIEVDCLMNCPDCYKYTHESVRCTVACQEPHLLLNVKLRSSSNFWASKKNISYWPARLIALLDNNKIRVLFFDHNEFIDVSSQNCLLYSTDSNTQSNPKIDSKDFENALAELELYVNALKGKFGRVVTNLPVMLFDRCQFNSHMKAMFPDWAGQTSLVDDANNDEGNIDDYIESDDEESDDEESDDSSSEEIPVSSSETESDEYSDSSCSSRPTKRARLQSPDHQRHTATDENMDFNLESNNSEVCSTEDGTNFTDMEQQFKNNITGILNFFNTAKTKNQDIETLKIELETAKKSIVEWEAKFNALSVQGQLKFAALEMQYDMLKLENSKMKLEHSEYKTKMANEIETMKAQHKQIVQKLGQKLNENRIKCKLCEKTLKFCSSECEESWNTFETSSNTIADMEQSK